MTTPTTPEQAKYIASHLLTHDATASLALRSLADQVEALTKERDTAVRKLAALSNAHALEDLYQVGLGQEREITTLTAERDAWKQAHDEQVAKLIEIANERDTLKDAAKLALDALEPGVSTYFERRDAAIAALKVVL